MQGTNGAAKEPLVKAKRFLDANDFFAAIIAEPEEVEIPGKGFVRLRGLTTAEVEQVVSAATVDGERNTAILMTQAVVRGLVEPQLGIDHVERLMQAGGGYILPLARRIMSLSGMGDVEELEKKAGSGS